jgi:hypothetical protein
MKLENISQVSPPFSSEELISCENEQQESIESKSIQNY